MKKVMLTTADNPYDPFTQFREWLLFDETYGYGCCALLGRLANTSDDLTDEENLKEIESSIDDIIKFDPLCIYKKVVSES